MQTRFNSVQDAALENLEAAIEEYQRGCIGHTRREMNRRCVSACYRRVKELHLEDALTPRETAACEECSHE